MLIAGNAIIAALGGLFVVALVIIIVLGLILWRAKVFYASVLSA